MATAHRTAEEEQAALIARATEEREKLFQRYERGREEGAEIDPWEDPGFEVYHQTDRYGFIHDKRLPQKPNPNEQKAKEIELERVKKWLKMLKVLESGTPAPRDVQEKMRRRVFKGIPDKLRSRVWMRLLNLDAVMAGKRDIYPKMLRLARTWGTEARQIDSDVNRQFREHLFYRERYSIKQRSLFNVLTAYSMYNMEVGYCQGMAGVAGVLLMYMDEEEAFWALSVLLSDEKYALHGLYIEGFPKLTRFLAHHDKIITKFLPKLKRQFDQFNLDSILYSLKWFFVIFIERIPFNICLRVWDIFLLDGDRVITAMAYTILRLHRSRILKLRDMDAIVQFIQVQLYKDFGFDEDHVIKSLEQSMEELKKAKLDVPPPPGESELPRGPFGVFKEPSFESQIGRRKSLFSEQEKEVTETVKLKREKTEQEIMAEINNNNDGSTKLPGTVIGSNGQLSSVHLAESEDGASLLGSSRKSLADTSVTSTADLSIFSGGQRSQNTYEDGYTINNSIHSNILYDHEDNNATPEMGNNIPEEEDDAESSPGSVYCTMSGMNRPPSTMRITPTPRAISPQDIVRIYVPPPPPEELLYDRPSDLRFQNVSSEGRSPESDCRTIIQRTPTELPGSVSTATITSQSMRSLNQHQYAERRISGGRDEEGSITSPSVGGGLETTLRELALYSSQNSLRGNAPGSTSSSRRGSMSRKSSILVESELASECPHIRVSSTSGRDSRKSSLSQRHSVGDAANNVCEYEAIIERAKIKRAQERKEPRIMTSFEKLAQMNDTFYFGGKETAGDEEEDGNGGGAAVVSRQGGEGVKKRQRQQQSDDEAFSYSYRGQKQRNGTAARNKCTSDYNIQYKARDDRNGGVGGGEIRDSMTGRGGGIVNSSGADAKEMMKNKKQYDRFFTPDESEESGEDMECPGSGVGVGKKKRVAKKSPHGEGNNNNVVVVVMDSSPDSVSGKSPLTTPQNETQPLIVEGNCGGGGLGNKVYNFKHARGVDLMMNNQGGGGGGRRGGGKKLSTDTERDDYEESGDGTPISSPGESPQMEENGGYIAMGRAGERVGGGWRGDGGEGGNNKLRIRVNEKSK